MRVGFLGLGLMGSHMARHLLQAGHELTVWNRTPARAEPLAAAGAHVAATPAEAARGNEAVISMLFDDKAHEDVLFGQGVLDAIEPGALHVAMSTISVALSHRLTDEHQRRGIGFVGAPVFGRPEIAEAGKLWVAAAGPGDLINRARPLFDPLSRGVSVVGAHPPQAHALKLGGNFLINAMIYGLSESFVYAQSQGIDPAVFFETVNDALFRSPFYAAYAQVMLHPPEKAGASIELGAKDLRLLNEAAAAGGVRLSLGETLADILKSAKAAGLQDEDWAVGQYEMARRRSRSNESSRS